ncbi:unnamed protein product [Caretta caretta]
MILIVVLNRLEGNIMWVNEARRGKCNKDNENIDKNVSYRETERRIDVGNDLKEEAAGFRYSSDVWGKGKERILGLSGYGPG